MQFTVTNYYYGQDIGYSKNDWYWDNVQKKIRTDVYLKATDDQPVVRIIMNYTSDTVPSDQARYYYILQDRNSGKPITCTYTSLYDKQFPEAFVGTKYWELCQDQGFTTLNGTNVHHFSFNDTNPIPNICRQIDYYQLESSSSSLFSQHTHRSSLRSSASPFGYTATCVAPPDTYLDLYFNWNMNPVDLSVFLLPPGTPDCEPDDNLLKNMKDLARFSF